MLTKVDKKRQAKTGDEYLVLSVTINRLERLQAVHPVRSHQAAALELNMDAHRQIVVEISQKTAATNQQYFRVEHVFRIGNVRLVDGKPAETVDAKAVEADGNCSSACRAHAWRALG